MNLLDTKLDRFQRQAFLAGTLALLISLVGALFNREHFFQSYLVAYLFWVGLALGSLAVLMLHHLVAGSWGFVIQRFLEAASRTLPLMILLFLPLLLGLHELYPWTHQEELQNPVLQHKTAYLNVPFFIARAFIYFFAWLTFAHFFNRWSWRQDQGEFLTKRMQLMAGPGLVAYVLTMTFASVDWVMSLEPHWYSTIFGLKFVVGQALAALAFSVLVVALLSKRQPLAGSVSAQHSHDLGNLLLAFVMLWAYIAFSQYLIIWSGNLPEEVPWYLRRTAGQWTLVAVVLILFHFASPFLLLLARLTKRRLGTLMKVAVLVLLMRLVDLFWLVMPAFYPQGPVLHWMDFTVWIGMGGIWVAIFLKGLKARPVLPLNDPRMELQTAHAG
ncbi:MAG: hypothetical protein HY645_03450 [Acidobacteria bacterium]|nr:hypothetical protein [Acidobacteriota bacterium]